MSARALAGEESFVTGSGWPTAELRRRFLRAALVWAAAVTAGHFVLGGTGGHLRHGAHVLLAALYFVAILLAAVARGARGGLLMAGGVSAVYLLHVAVRQSPGSGQVLDELAVVAGYLVVGASAGLLVREADRRREERDRVLAVARLSEVRSGLEALVEALGARDPELREHSRRVAEVAEQVARQLGLDRGRRAEIHLAGLLHDVGKLGLHDGVLFSNGGLSPEQREQVHAHPLRAADLISSIGGDDELANLVLSHHECPDGTGYPRGLRGDEIPFGARVLRVADVFAAVTEQRSYRASDSYAGALATMRTMAPEKVDPICLAALESVVRDGWWRDREDHPSDSGSEATNHDEIVTK